MLAAAPVELDARHSRVVPSARPTDHVDQNAGSQCLVGCCARNFRGSKLVVQVGHLNAVGCVEN